MDRRDALAAARRVCVSERSRLLNFYRRHGGDSEAEDLAQKAITQLLETGGIDKKGNPIQNARAFLWKIARRVMRRQWDKEPVVSGDGEAADLTHTPALENELQAITLAYELRSQSKYRFLVLQGEGWRSRDTARLRGSTVGGLRTHLCECRKEFRARHGQALKELLAA